MSKLRVSDNGEGREKEINEKKKKSKGNSRAHTRKAYGVGLSDSNLHIVHLKANPKLSRRSLDKALGTI